MFKFELTVCLGYHSCLTQRLGSHKYAESVMYLLLCNIVICIIVRAWFDVDRSRKKFCSCGSMHFITNRQTIISGHHGESHAQSLSSQD